MTLVKDSLHDFISSNSESCPLREGSFLHMQPDNPGSYLVYPTGDILMSVSESKPQKISELRADLFKENDLGLMIP